MLVATIDSKTTKTKKSLKNECSLKHKDAKTDVAQIFGKSSTNFKL